ncbi:MAG: response regulator [Pseudomonadota bacterium]
MTAKRVLIAEDEPHIVESLRFILNREGYDVDDAPDGEAAWDRLRDARPDVLILDVMLPRLNGFDLLRRLRADPGAAGTPVLMLTAKGQAQDRRTALDAGADAFITKPFANRDVVEHVRRLLQA